MNNLTTTTPSTVPAAPSILTSTSTTLPPHVGAPQTSSSLTSVSSTTSTTPPASAPRSSSPTPTSTQTAASSKPTSTSSAAPNVTQRPAPGPHSSNNRLASGVVAGIVVAVAVGIALLTFLATFFIMRRKRNSRGELQRGTSSDRRIPGANAGPRDFAREPKGPTVTEAGSDLATFENFLPQSADDNTIRSKAKTTLDQIELYVENFYQDASAASTPNVSKLATFESPYLPSSVSSLLQQSRNRRALIKHSLARFVTSSISPTAGPDNCLLPTEFALLPRALEGSKTNTTAKLGFDQSMSRWRALTAYLRPSPAEDPIFITQRQDLINNIVRAFSEAFDPWKNVRYTDEDRDRSLSAVLGEAAELGIFIFSQPSLLQFHWPKPKEINSSNVVVTPALIKLTDERGHKLKEGQILVDLVTQKL